MTDAPMFLVRYPPPRPFGGKSTDLFAGETWRSDDSQSPQQTARLWCTFRPSFLLRALSRRIEDSRSLLNIEGLIEQTVKLTDHENPNIRQQVIVMLTTMLKFGQLFWTRGVRHLSFSHCVDHTRKKFLDVDVLFDLKWLLRGQDTEVSMVYCLYEMTKYGALVSIRGLEARLRNMYWASENDSERQAMDDASRKVASLVSAGAPTLVQTASDAPERERGRGPAANKSAMKSEPTTTLPIPPNGFHSWSTQRRPKTAISGRRPLAPGSLLPLKPSASRYDSPPQLETQPNGDAPGSPPVPVQNNRLGLLLGRTEESQQRYPPDVAHSMDAYPMQPRHTELNPAYTNTEPLPLPLPPDTDHASSEDGISISSPERTLALEYWDETSEGTEGQRTPRSVIDWSRISTRSDAAHVGSEASSSVDPEDAQNHPEAQLLPTLLQPVCDDSEPSTDRPMSQEPSPTSAPEPAEDSEAIRGPRPKFHQSQSIHFRTLLRAGKRLRATLTIPTQKQLMRFRRSMTVASAL
ncbi:hypothetical protein IMY05_C4840000300 [Salix suchowensis]|nr:hypothetical protein IMY05_C4840000300 [Salix suchowensis]